MGQGMAMSVDYIRELLETIDQLDEETKGRPEHPEYEELEDELDSLQSELGWGEYIGIGQDDLVEAGTAVLFGEPVPPVPEGARPFMPSKKRKVDARKATA